MALIPVYHVVPSYYPVDPAHDAVASPIIMGEFIAIASTGYVAKASDTNAIGIAGDTIATDQGYTPYAADIVISGGGATRSTSNRVSDYFDETRGSGKMTVYHSGGEFWTDRYVTTANWHAGDVCYSSTAGKLTTAAVDANSIKVGRVISGPSDYPSGVPGTDIQGSMALGQYVHFKLDL
jgi:hypothetical protein